MAAWLVAGAAAATPPGTILLEDFDHAHPTLVREGAAATMYFASVAAGGWKSPRALKLASVPPTGSWTQWAVNRKARLGGANAVSFAARADGPAELILILKGGGKCYLSVTVDGSWREFTLPFDELPGQGGRFDPGRYEGWSVAAEVLPVPGAMAARAPVDVWLDAVSARRVPPSSRLNINFSSMDYPFGWSPVGWGSAGIVWAGLGEGAHLWSFFTADEPYAPTRSMDLAWDDLPHDYRRATGISLTVKVAPAAPLLLLKIVLQEAGGERFLALRDAPVEYATLAVPLDEFVPDAAWNQNLPPGKADGRLDTGALAAWMITLMPTTELPARGKLFIRDAWATAGASKKPVLH